MFSYIIIAQHTELKTQKQICKKGRESIFKSNADKVKIFKRFKWFTVVCTATIINMYNVENQQQIYIMFMYGFECDI